MNDLEQLNCAICKYVSAYGLESRGYIVSDQDHNARLERALDIAYKTTCVGQADHLLWTIDQMVRALTGCDGENGELESEMYKEWVKKYETDDWKWEVGVCP